MLSPVDMVSTSLYAAIQVPVLYLLNHTNDIFHINHVKIHFYNEMPFLRVFTL